MKTMRAAVLTCTFVSLAALPQSLRAQVVEYRIDTAHTHVGFTVRHLMVSNVRGKFNEFSGTIRLDEQDLTSATADVVIKAASIDTNNERRDNHLRSADFFDVERFPEIRFTGSGVERTEEGLVLVGELTMKDVTRPVRLPFELAGPVPAGQGRQRIGAEASLTIDRHTYGLTWNTLADAGPVVGAEVRIELALEAVTAAADS